MILVSVITSCSSLGKTKRPTPDNLKMIKSLALVIPTELDFTVINESAKGFGPIQGIMGSLAGGLAGIPNIASSLVVDSVTSQYNKSLDNKEREHISPQVDKLSYRSVFLESLLNTLKSTKNFTKIKIFDKKIDKKDSNQYDAIAIFSIQNLGLRLTDHNNGQMATFIEVEVKMIQTKDSTTLWKEHQVVLGQRRHKFDSYKKNVSLLQTELKETVIDAGTRMAKVLKY